MTNGSGPAARRARCGARRGAVAVRPRAFGRGFTLVETIATIAILGAIGSIASMLIMTSVRGFSDAAVAAQVHAELSLALERIDRELRNIEPDAVSPPAPNIASVAADSISWNDDYSLSLSGDQLMLVENGGTSRVLLDDVTAFSVQAYNEANAALAASLSGAACDPIRRLLVTITMQRNGITQTLRTKVYLRSTMD